MAFHFFHVRARDPKRDQDELNAFMAANRGTAVGRQFDSSGPEPAWLSCLSVAEGPGPLPSVIRAD